MNKTLRAIFVGVGVFAYIPLTFFAYITIITLVFDTNWQNVDIFLIAPNIIYLISWLLIPIASACYLLMDSKKKRIK